MRGNISDHDRDVIDSLVRLNPQRMELLKMVCKLGSRFWQMIPWTRPVWRLCCQLSSMDSCGSVAEAMMQQGTNMGRPMEQCD
ncbi:hypothetical protein HDU98_001105, partial [Podochytrium sp. JEL0797]